MYNKILAGVDEVGRGCLAGPVISCAIIYYMKDLSVALGKSDRISPEISVWPEETLNLTGVLVGDLDASYSPEV